MTWENVFYSPEKYGLQSVGVIDFSDGNYVFDYTAVWLDGEGNLLYADDAGCSCPSPFEAHKLEDLKKTNLAGLQAHLEERYAEESEWLHREEQQRVWGEIVELLGRLAMRRYG